MWSQILTHARGVIANDRSISLLIAGGSSTIRHTSSLLSGDTSQQEAALAFGAGVLSWFTGDLGACFTAVESIVAGEGRGGGSAEEKGNRYQK